MCCVFFFFNDTATTEIYTLSLHDALPISEANGPAPAKRSAIGCSCMPQPYPRRKGTNRSGGAAGSGDRKSTRLNSSHANISYAVFCLKKKQKLSSDEIAKYI